MTSAISGIPNNWTRHFDRIKDLDSFLIDDPKISLDKPAASATTQTDLGYTVSLSRPSAKAVPAQPTKSAAVSAPAETAESNEESDLTGLIAAVTAKTVAEAKEKKLNHDETGNLFKSNFMVELGLA